MFPSHHLHQLLGEFEGRPLEAQVAGRGREDKPVVNVNNVALVIQQNIPVMPVTKKKSMNKKK